LKKRWRVSKREVALPTSTKLRVFGGRGGDDPSIVGDPSSIAALLSGLLLLEATLKTNCIQAMQRARLVRWKGQNAGAFLVETKRERAT